MSDPAAKKPRDSLRKYLSQYYRAKERMETLERRKARLQRELGKLPRELNAMIARQRENQALAIVEVTRALDFLPAESIEREILELRHIDCMNWLDIQEKVHLSKSPCFDYYNKGLDALLGIEAVGEALAKFEAQHRERNGGGH